MTEILMVACLWFGFWIGMWHQRRKPNVQVEQLREAARKILDRARFVGEGDFVTTYEAVLSYDGHSFKIAMMEERVGRAFSVYQTMQ